MICVQRPAIGKPTGKWGLIHKPHPQTSIQMGYNILLTYGNLHY